MGKIGIIGGLSPFSTVVYYSRIVEEFNHIKGGLKYPEILVASLNMAHAKAALNSSDDDIGLRLLVGAVADLPTADFFLIASNTMHFYVDKLRSICPREVIDIRQVTADEVLKYGHRRVLLLGSKATMSSPCFVNYFQRRGLDVVLPEKEYFDVLDHLIYERLCRGDVDDDARAFVNSLIDKAVDASLVEAVVLACTEFSLLDQKMFKLPVFDSTELHVRAAISKILR